MPLDWYLLGWRRFSFKNLSVKLLSIERAKVLLHDFLHSIDVLLLLFNCQILDIPGPQLPYLSDIFSHSLCIRVNGVSGKVIKW